MRTTWPEVGGGGILPAGQGVPRGSGARSHEFPALGSCATVPMPLLAVLALALAALPQEDGRAQRRIRPPTRAELALQSFPAHVERVAAALDDLGAPLVAAEREALEAARAAPESAELAAALAARLEERVLAVVAIDADGRLTATKGPAARALDEGDAVTFLVRVENAARATSVLTLSSAQAVDEGGTPDGARWLELRVFVGPFVRRELAGLPREYRVVSLGAARAGAREATLRFELEAEGARAAQSAEPSLEFDVRPAVPVALVVRDERGEPATAAFTVRDARGALHPSPALRRGADLRFQKQVYRADGEALRLQPGAYAVEVRRGPEFLPQRRTLVVAEPANGAGNEARNGALDGSGAHSAAPRLEVVLERWIDPAASSWWSGDHHVHGSGCMHYLTPDGGVGPEAMLRHARGEDLKVARCLVWGVGWDEQQGFFTGAQDVRSTPPYLLQYDLEISGFGSEHAGHWCLLGLKQHEYDGKPGIVHWPDLGLTVLAWAKRQGGFTSTVHSGLGLAVDTREVPNVVVPPFDSIGANEFVVDVAHELPGPDGKPRPAVDLYGVGDTAWPWELNLVYHVLRAGFRVRLAGEDDFPCLDESAIGRGRSYVKVPVAAKDLTQDAWLAGLVAGRSYVGDGRSHLMDFRVDDVEVGTRDVELPAPRAVRVRANAAALLPVEPDLELARRSWKAAPYWHVERARVPGTREVEVELVVDGLAVAKQRLVADGVEREVAFELPVERSCWVALRVLPSCHTNPIWIDVGGAPLQPSKSSCEFLLACVERCWERKARTYEGPGERAAAQTAYDHARAEYRRRAARGR